MKKIVFIFLNPEPYRRAKFPAPRACDSHAAVHRWRPIPAGRKIFGSLLLIFHLLLAPKPGTTQSLPRPFLINEVEIYGNHAFTPVIIENIFKLPDNSFSIAQVQKKAQNLLDLYLANGYYYAAIDSLTARVDSSSQRVALAIYLQEGPQFILDAVRFTGLNRGDSLQWLPQIETRPGGTLEIDRLTRDIQSRLEFAANRGYPLSQITVDSVKLQRPRHNRAELRLVLRVTNGPRISINELLIRGNRLTRARVIQRETRFKSGQIYNQQKIDQIPRRLMRLGFLEAVGTPQLFLKEDGQAGLLITVKEGTANQFDGVVGYTPGTLTQKGYFTGLLNLTLGNLLGTGRKITAYWQKKDRQSQALTFSYFEPWLFQWPIHAGFEFKQLIQDTTYIERDWGLEIQLPLADNLMIHTRGGWHSILPDSIGSVIFKIPASRASYLSLGLSYDTRDDLLNPRRGFFYYTALEMARKTNQSNFDFTGAAKKDFNQKKLRLDLELYWPIFQRQVLAGAIHGRQITSSEAIIPLAEHFRLGGTRTLRGYREEQFRGSRLAWVNLEYRYLLSRRSRLFLFGDGGYYSRREISGEIKGVRSGYGFGMRIETRLGIMGVDYGLGEGSGLMAGLIHVSLLNEF